MARLLAALASAVAVAAVATAAPTGAGDVGARLDKLGQAVSAAAGAGAVVNLQSMRGELEALRGELAARGGRGGGPWAAKAAAMQRQLDELEEMLTTLAAEEAKSQDRIVVVSHAELQKEIERLKRDVRRAGGFAPEGPGQGRGEGAGAEEGERPYAPSPAAAGRSGDGHDARRGAAGGAHDEAQAGNTSVADMKAGARDQHEQEHEQDREAKGDVEHKEHGAGRHDGHERHEGREAHEGHGGHRRGARGAPSGAGSRRGGADADSSMPFGNLEPFGREDTARELTEASLRESDAMVDQIERAEVAEEKRAMFRALTRLRGVAITSFDGVARAHTGNVDEYTSKSQWRRNHPLRHLANEEADVSRWAFPAGNN